MKAEGDMSTQMQTLEDRWQTPLKGPVAVFPKKTSLVRTLKMFRKLLSDFQTSMLQVLRLGEACFIINSIDSKLTPGA